MIVVRMRTILREVLYYRGEGMSAISSLCWSGGGEDYWTRELSLEMPGEGIWSWKVSLMICRSYLYETRYYLSYYCLLGLSSYLSCSDLWQRYAGIWRCFRWGCSGHRWWSGCNLLFWLWGRGFCWSATRIAKEFQGRSREGWCYFLICVRQIERVLTGWVWNFSWGIVFGIAGGLFGRWTWDWAMEKGGY